MFGLSFAEIAVVIVVIVVVFGPEKLPEVARLISKGYREMRKITNSVRDAVSFEDDFRDTKERYNYIVEEVKNPKGPATPHTKPLLNAETATKPTLYAISLPPQGECRWQEINLPAGGAGEVHRKVPLS